MEEDIKV